MYMYMCMCICICTCTCICVCVLLGIIGYDGNPRGLFFSLTVDMKSKPGQFGTKHGSSRSDSLANPILYIYRYIYMYMNIYSLDTIRYVRGPQSGREQSCYINMTPVLLSK